MFEARHGTRGKEGGHITIGIDGMGTAESKHSDEEKRTAKGIDLSLYVSLGGAAWRTLPMHM